MTFTGPLDDQFAIRSLHDSYADAVHRRDAAAWGALWATDCRWELMGMTVDGRAAAVALWEGAMAGFAFVAFFSQCGAIVIDPAGGPTATGRSFTSEVLETLDGTVSRPVGRYDDRFVRTPDGWRYAARRFTLLKA